MPILKAVNNDISDIYCEEKDHSSSIVGVNVCPIILHILSV